MTEDVPLRAGLLLGLVVLGVGLGYVGTALGLGDPITDPDPTAEVHVSEHDVTIESEKDYHTVVENATGVGSVEIAAKKGGIDVDTESPLTDADRERARRIARNNATIRGYLEELGNAELAVEPIYGVTADEVKHVNLSEEIDGTSSYGTVVNATGEAATFTVENFSVTRSEGSVTVTQQSFVEDQVYVLVRRAGENAVLYEAQVNLADEEVVVAERAPSQE